MSTYVHKPWIRINVHKRWIQISVHNPWIQISVHKPWIHMCIHKPWIYINIHKPWIHISVDKPCCSLLWNTCTWNARAENDDAFIEKIHVLVQQFIHRKRQILITFETLILSSCRYFICWNWPVTRLSDISHGLFLSVNLIFTFVVIYTFLW